MTHLHDAMKTLLDGKDWTTFAQLAQENAARGLWRRPSDGKFPTPDQMRWRAGGGRGLYKDSFEVQGDRIRLRASKSGNSLPLFIEGQLYKRAELHQLYGGQQQGGISTPRSHPLVFLITGESGAAYGYKDGTQSDGTFWYTGEGQVGDMKMTKGNAAIMHHAENGRSIHLFRDVGRGYLQYISAASYLDHHAELAPDRDGRPRNALVFELALETSGEGTGRTSLAEPPPRRARGMARKTLAQLRRLALKGAARNATPAQRKRNVYQRSEAVREYVLRRAEGSCEACGNAAPFVARDDRLYLEPHHIRRLADGGPDHPRWVAAICPNCHRRVHCGKDGEDFNAGIADAIGRLEPD